MNLRPIPIVVLALSLCAPVWAHEDEPHDLPPDPAEAFYAVCAHDLREEATGCREGITARAEECVARIGELMANGSVEDAHFIAGECLEAIEVARDECLGALREECERCVGVLVREFSSEPLAEDLRGVCGRLADSVEETVAEARRKIGVALERPDREPPEDFAERCLREVSTEAIHCIEMTADITRECVARIRRLLDEGKTDDARALAEQCISDLYAHTDECYLVLQEQCEWCIDILVREYEAPDLAEKMARACEEWQVALVTAEEAAIAAIRLALELPPVDLPAAQFAEECLREMRHRAQDCVEKLAIHSLECFEQIVRLLLEGEVEEARAVADRCLDYVEETEAECLERLKETCGRCVGVLRDEFEAEDLASRVEAVCVDLLTFVEMAAGRAAEAISAAFDEPPAPGPAEVFAHECIETVRAAAERCAAEIFHRSRECTERIKHLLEEGLVEEAQVLAAECAADLEALANACKEDLAITCRRCIEALIADFGAEDLADRVEHVCANQTEFVDVSLRLALRHLNELFDDTSEAGRFARACAHDIRELAEDARAENQRMAVWCAFRVLTLVDEGRLDEAHAVAQECIDRISANTAEAVGAMRRRCEECVSRLLDDFDAPDLAEAMEAGCGDEIDHLLQTESRAIHLVQLALNAEPLPEDDELDARGLPELVDGDADHSGDVDSSDVQIVINRVLGHSVPTFNRYDMNGDARVDAVDIQVVINRILGL
jgi:hypothetical protein